MKQDIRLASQKRYEDLYFDIHYSQRNQAIYQSLIVVFKQEKKEGTDVMDCTLYAITDGIYVQVSVVNGREKGVALKLKDKRKKSQLTINNVLFKN